MVVSGCSPSPLAAQPPDPLEAKVRGPGPPALRRAREGRPRTGGGRRAGPEGPAKAVQSPNDAELRARAAVVAEKIERAARSKRLLAAPKLALKFDKVPLDQAVNRVRRARPGSGSCWTRPRIKDLDRTVTLDTGEVPFWEAVHAFYEAAGLTEDDSPATPPDRPEV